MTNALGMAITNRNPDADCGVVIHSDHGTRFTSWALTHRARQSGLVPSMGSIGDCYDCGKNGGVSGSGLGPDADRTAEPEAMNAPR